MEEENNRELRRSGKELRIGNCRSRTGIENYGEVARSFEWATAGSRTGGRCISNMETSIVQADDKGRDAETVRSAQA